MCLGVPGKVIRWLDRDPTFALAEIEFEGLRRQCYMACVPDAAEGSYVIVHAGIAICQLDTEEAQRVLREIQILESEGASEPGTAPDAPTDWHPNSPRTDG